MSDSRPIVEFDQYSQSYADSWADQLKHIREECPVAWSESYDGFWVISKYEDIVFVEQHPEIFSCDNDPKGERGGAKGVRIPPNPMRFDMMESDPPYHTSLRKLMAPFFTLDYLAPWTEFARALVDEQIDSIIETGRGDLVADLCIPVPAQTTLSMMGVPREEWRNYSKAAMNGFLPVTHPDFPHEVRRLLSAQIDEMLADRRRNPRQDIMSALANAKVDGQPLEHSVAKGILQAAIFGGFDTTAATTASALHWLEGRTEMYDRLIEDDQYLDKFVHECLRFFPPIAGGLARTVMQDTELRGQKMKAGDRLLLLWNSGNFDEDRFECPYQFDMERKNGRRHLSFGSGPHRCLGAPLGISEVGTMIRGVLRRMPDYRIDRENARRFPVLGTVNGWLTMPFTFTPGKRRA